MQKAKYPLVQLDVLLTNRRVDLLQGLGFTMLPHTKCMSDLQTGRLVRLLPGWNLPGGTCRRSALTGAVCCQRCAPGSIT